MKKISADTIIIIPKNKSKTDQYQDLMVKTFYLNNAKSKEIVNLLRSMLDVKKVYVNEILNSITIRDTPEKIKLVEKMIAANDLKEGGGHPRCRDPRNLAQQRAEVRLEFPKRLCRVFNDGHGPDHRLHRCSQYLDLRHRPERPGEPLQQERVPDAAERGGEPDQAGLRRPDPGQSPGAGAEQQAGQVPYRRQDPDTDLDRPVHDRRRGRPRTSSTRMSASS